MEPLTCSSKVSACCSLFAGTPASWELAAVAWARPYPVQMSYHHLKMCAQDDDYLGKHQEQAMLQGCNHSYSSLSKASVLVLMEAAACYQQSQCLLQGVDQIRSLHSARSQGVASRVVGWGQPHSARQCSQPSLCQLQAGLPAAQAQANHHMHV
jgi:hypothetical protein